jgi:hypothetical protein
MINTREVTDAYLYSLGTWTSQILYNSRAGMPTGVTSEWGYLAWDEQYVGSGYTGEIRIDILDIDDNVLIADIVKNIDGTPTTLYSSVVALEDIKIRVKLYALDDPTPKVSNIRINFYNNTTANQVITNTGKNLIFNRTSLDSPTVTGIQYATIGNNQSTQLSDDTASLTNEESSDLTFRTIVYNASDRSYTATIYVNSVSTMITNGTTVNSIAFKNGDATKLFCGAVRYADNIINEGALPTEGSYNYYFKAKFKLYPINTTTTMITEEGERTFLDRTFEVIPTYTAISRYVAGEHGTLTADMTGLDTEHTAPNPFIYTLLDTSAIKMTLIFIMDETTGNGYNYNAIGHENTDGTPTFILGVKLDETITKSSSYYYTFTTKYLIKPYQSTNIL